MAANTHSLVKSRLILHCFQVVFDPSLDAPPRCVQTHHHNINSQPDIRISVPSAGSTPKQSSQEHNSHTSHFSALFQCPALLNQGTEHVKARNKHSCA